MATTDVTSDSTVYPSENEVETAEFAGSRGQEFYHAAYFEAVSDGFVSSGWTVPATHGDLGIPVAAGSGIIKGRRIVTDSSNDVTLTDNATNHVFMQIVLDGSNNVTTVQLVSNTSGTPPSNSIYLARAVTSGGTVTAGVNNGAPGHIYDTSVTGANLRLYQGTDYQTGILGIGGAETTLATVVIAAATLKNGTVTQPYVHCDGDFYMNTGAAGTVTVRIRSNGVLQESRAFAPPFADTERYIRIRSRFQVDHFVSTTVTLTAQTAGAGGVWSAKFRDLTVWEIN